MNLRTYLITTPDYQVKSVYVDLENREPLSDEQVAALLLEQTRLHQEHARLYEEIRLVTERLVQSGEEKLRRMREGLI